MKILLLLIPISLLAAELTPAPKVSDASKAAYTKALQEINAAQANAIQLIAAVKKAQDDSAKALSDANDAAQKVLVTAQKECGDKAQLDGKALQERGELVCLVVPVK